MVHRTKYEPAPELHFPPGKVIVCIGAALSSWALILFIPIVMGWAS